jgi:hypothetical protein
MKGIDNGTIEMSSVMRPEGRASAFPWSGASLLCSMPIAIPNRIKPRAMRNAASVMPNSWKIIEPSSAKVNNTADDENARDGDDEILDQCGHAALPAEKTCNYKRSHIACRQHGRPAR